MKKIALVLGLVLLVGTAAFATPSTQIWIPSTDIQPFKKIHFGFDHYIKASGLDSATREPNVINNGITVGVLPSEKIQMEEGIDQRAYGIEPYDSAPIYWNAKLGTPEGSLFEGSPALAVGGYDFGTKKYTTRTRWIDRDEKERLGDQENNTRWANRKFPLIGTFTRRSPQVVRPRNSAGYHRGGRPGLACSPSS